MQILSFANTGIQVGDRAPDFELIDDAGEPWRLYTMAAGRPILMLLYPGAEHPAAAAALDALAETAAATVDVLAIGRQAAAGRRTPPLRRLHDRQGQVHTAYGFEVLTRAPGGDGAVLVLLGPDLRVTGVWPAGEAAAALAAADRPAVTPLVNPPGLAPVLMIPRVFEPAFCHHLIEVFETRGNEESGIFLTAGGRSRQTIDHGIKKRRDHHVTAEPLLGRLTALMQRRVLPEIDRVFCFQVTNAEEFKIVRYDAETGGYFRPHRDNLNPQNAHRRFAMTINLNTEDYEGGHLRFPEYGPHLYRPPSGGAVVFSCSLLHEATDVSRGRRYVLLSFFHGAAEDRRRRGG